jgi:hypothetical protein
LKIISGVFQWCIKEDFSAKERDCPVDESSDSEDDNEIPFPRFKKKSSWIPKPSKNTALESFIDLVKNDVQTATSTNIPTSLQQKKVRYKN